MSRDEFINHSRSNQWLSAPTAMFQDEALSYEAEGLLATLLSRPPNWRVIPSALIRPRNGKAKVYGLLTELMEARYVERFDWVDDSGQRQFSSYHVYDERQPGEMPKHRQKLSNPDPGVPLPKPVGAFRELASRDLENRHTTYKRDQQSIDQTHISPTSGETVIASDLPLTDRPSLEVEHESTSYALTETDFKAQETTKTPKAVKHTLATEKAAKKPRERDLIWDAICEAFFKRELTDPSLSGARGQGKLIGIAAGKVRQFDATITADEIREAAQRFFGFYPDIKCIHDGDKIISKIEELRAHKADLAAKKAAAATRQLAGNAGLVLSPQSARIAQNNPRNVRGVIFDD
jgi:hypothetical protein